MAEAKAKSRHDFNPFAEELIASPYEPYRMLRSQDPVHWSGPLKAWVLTRFDNVTAVLNDPSFEAIPTSHAVAEIGRRTRRDYAPLIRFLDAVPFLLNGEPHQRDRRTMAKVMSRIPLSQLEAVAQKIALSLVSALAPGDRFDAIGAFADPFPQLIMAHILGIPDSDVPFLAEKVADLTLVFDPAGFGNCDAANAQAEAALDLLMRRIEERKAEPTGLGIIYEAAPGSGLEKLQSAAASALFAYRVGAETTIGLIGLLLRTLADQPQLRQTMTQRPEIIDLLGSEVLRRESNVQRVARVATQPRQVGGKQIEKGDRLLLLLGAANLDPQAFACPHQIQLAEKRPPDLSFGAGAHFCLGASLARLEARVTLKTFLACPALERDGPEKWYAGLTIRRLTALPLRMAVAA